MIKVRVYEVARDLGLENQDLMLKMRTLGIQVRNHMSSLDPAEVDRVKRHLEKEKAESLVEERIRPTVVRRRTVHKGGAPASATAGSMTVAAAPAPSRTPVPAMETRATDVVTGPMTPAPAPEKRTPPPKPIESVEPAAARAPAPPAAPSFEVPEDVHASAPEAPPPEEQPRIGAAVVARGGVPIQRPGQEEQGDRNQPSQPPPASERLRHANLPPGVISRGNLSAPAAPTPSQATVSRIVSEHGQRQTGGTMRPGAFQPGEAPRRRELTARSLGPTGRQQARPGRRKPAPGKKGKETQITVPSAQKRVIRIEDQVQLQTLAQRMGIKATDVLMKLMQLGVGGVHINSTLDADTAKIIASDFGYEVENVARSDDEMVTEARGTFSDLEEERELRPPIVTVMGHVDHGKTSLLDKIRSADVASGEAGGITQHIGAYRVDTESGPVVFLDTPGHEAFTAMRARGAQATDVVILVVAADDGVMPQTKEAIAHAKAAEVPIVVAINKIDKPEAKPEVVKRELVNEGLQPEEWGGDTMFVEVSARTGDGIDKLLEGVLLQSEMLELRANPGIPAEGVVLEAYLDKGRGPVANMLVRNGTLKIGDFVVAGSAWGRVRALTDDRGKQAKEAPPATPVELLGLNEMPSAGDSFYVVTEAKRAQEIAEQRRTQKGPQIPQARGLDQIYQMMQAGETHELKLVIKADVQGSVEAIVKALSDLSTEKVKVNVIHTGVGGITENDVMLASASNAIVIGFGVRPAGNAAATAKSEGVDVRMYSIIYEAVDEVKKAMAGLLAPTEVQKDLGKAEVRQVFNIPKAGTVAGCYVLDGKITRSAKVRLVRDSVVVWEGAVASLRRFKDDVREVTAGFECGISLAGYNDVKEKDVIEAFEIEQVQATLE